METTAVKDQTKKTTQASQSPAMQATPDLRTAVGAPAGLPLFMQAEMYIQPKLKVSQPGDPDEQEADRIAEQVVSSTPRRTQIGTWRSAGQPLSLSSRTIQAKLHVGSLDDPIEHEADQIARKVVDSEGSTCTCGSGSSKPCSSCREKAEPAIYRKAKPAAPGGNAATSICLGNGQPLAAAERGFFEPRFGADLGDVRIHTDTQAEHLAKQLNARAFTLQNDIAFGRGEYQPQSNDGRLLIAHELAHFLGNHSGLRRQGSAGANFTPADANASYSPPPEGAQSSLRNPARVTHDANFNPCRVDVGALTNYQLLAEYSSALSVVNQGRDVTGYFDYRNLQRRLIVERDRRVELGHAWLATMPSTIPDPLYRIVDGVAGAFQVLTVPGATVVGAPENTASSPLMTQAQFDRFLETRSVERVSADTYRLRTFGAAHRSAGFGTTLTTGGLYNRPQDLFRMFNPTLDLPATPFVRGGALPSPFDQPAWFQRLPGYMQTDLLLNPPALDPARSEAMARMLRGYRNTPGVPPRVDAIGMANESVQGGTAAVAQTDIPTLTGRNFAGASAEALPPALRGTPGTLGGDVLIAANPTAVNHGEHVALENLRLEIEEGLRRGVITRESLRGRTVFVMVEQEPCPSCAAGAGKGRAGVLQQFAELYPELTVEVRNMRTSRAFLYRNGQLLNPLSGVIPIEALAPTTQGAPRGLTPAQLDALMTPELRRSIEVGDFRAGGRATLRGAGLGAGFAVLANGTIILLDSQQHPNWDRDLAISGGLGAAGGGTGSLTEQMVISGLNRTMISDVTATGASRLTPGLVTGTGRFGGGAVGAMFVEGISMGLLEEREHSGAEVGTRLGRSGVLGGGSVWAGAAVGTAVGGPVGFIVGLAVGGLLYYVGDKLVPGGREDWDAIEAGCTPLPSLTRLSGASAGGFNSPMFNCFEANTPISLADGGTCRIADLAPGDLILSYNQREACIEVRPVTAIHEAPPDIMLELRFRNGAVVQITHKHKLCGPDGWRSANELRVGEELWYICPEHAGKASMLTPITLEAVRTIMPRGAVYDLSVEETHTYFASGILAHNKLP